MSVSVSPSGPPPSHHPKKVQKYIIPKKLKNTKIQKKKSKLTYRGKGKLNRRNSAFSVMLPNIRGYKCKEHSLKKILKKVKPSMKLS